MATPTQALTGPDEIVTLRLDVVTAAHVQRVALVAGLSVEEAAARLLVAALTACADAVGEPVPSPLPPRGGH